MASPDQPLSTGVFTAIAARERRVFLVTAIIAVALVLGAIAFLFYSAMTLRNMQDQTHQAEVALFEKTTQLQKASADLDQVQPQLEAAQRAVTQSKAEAEKAKAEVLALQQQLADANAELAGLREEIRLSVDYEQHLHAVDWEDAKLLFGTSDRIGDVLEKILEFRQNGLKFSTANDPAKGFTSPGFADYLLKQVGSPGLEELPKTTEPKLGDIVLYRGGFALFYFEDHDRKPFVIGMTPVGIAALEPDFGVPRTGVLSTGFLENR